MNYDSIIARDLQKKQAHDLNSVISRSMDLYAIAEIQGPIFIEQLIQNLVANLMFMAAQMAKDGHKANSAKSCGEAFSKMYEQLLEQETKDAAIPGNLLYEEPKS